MANGRWERFISSFTMNTKYIYKKHKEEKEENKITENKNLEGNRIFGGTEINTQKIETLLKLHCSYIKMLSEMLLFYNPF